MKSKPDQENNHRNEKKLYFSKIIVYQIQVWSTLCFLFAMAAFDKIVLFK